jgi:hypothetical protein
MSIKAKKEMLVLLEAELPKTSGAKKESMLKKIDFIKKSLDKEMQENPEYIAQQKKIEQEKLAKEKQKIENEKKSKLSAKKKLLRK